MQGSRGDEHRFCHHTLYEEHMPSVKLSMVSRLCSAKDFKQSFVRISSFTI